MPDGPSELAAPSGELGDRVGSPRTGGELLTPSGDLTDGRKSGDATRKRARTDPNQTMQHATSTVSAKFKQHHSMGKHANTSKTKAEQNKGY